MKDRIYGSLTDHGGSERVGFKEEDELVLSYARWRVMMWLSIRLPPPPSPPTAGESTHGFKRSQAQSSGKFSLD